MKQTTMGLPYAVRDNHTGLDHTEVVGLVEGYAIMDRLNSDYGSMRYTVGLAYFYRSISTERLRLQNHADR